MDNKKSPSFPFHFEEHPDSRHRAPSIHHDGLTKLEYASIMAMQGILLNLAIADKSLAKLQREYYAEKYPNATECECVAKESIEMATSLLNHLSKTQGK